MPVMLVAFGVKPKLKALFPMFAEWHFNFLSATAILFKAFIAFYPQECSSYSIKQYPFDTPPSLTKLKNFNLPKVQQIFLTCQSFRVKGSPPKYILLSVPIVLESNFFRYLSARKSFGFTILKVVFSQLNSAWTLKKSLILREDMVRIAKVLALSKRTSLMGSGMANSGLDAAMTVLKY